MSANIETHTWEAAIDPPEAATAQTSETEAAPVEEVAAPTESATAEAQTPAPAEPSGAAAREAPAAVEATAEEVQPAEDVTAEDPPEIKALPTPSARKWARGRDKQARTVDAFYDPQTPILSVAEDLYDKSKSRYGELVNSLYDAHEDYLIQRKFGMTAEELKAKLGSPQTAEASTTQPPDQDAYDPLEDATQPESVKQQLRELAELKKQFGEVKGEVAEFRSEKERIQHEERQTKVQQIETDLLTSVTSVVPETIREYGLEVSDKDSDVVKGLKQAAARVLLSELGPAFDSVEDNVKAVARAKDFASRLERANAFREEDSLKVRTRAALQKVKDENPEIAAILHALETVTRSTSQQMAQRGTRDPAVPGAQITGATVPPPPTTWEAAIDQAAR